MSTPRKIQISYKLKAIGSASPSPPSPTTPATPFSYLPLFIPAFLHSRPVPLIDLRLPSLLPSIPYPLPRPISSFHTPQSFAAVGWVGGDIPSVTSNIAAQTGRVMSASRPSPFQSGNVGTHDQGSARVVTARGTKTPQTGSKNRLAVAGAIQPDSDLEASGYGRAGRVPRKGAFRRIGHRGVGRASLLGGALGSYLEKLGVVTGEVLPSSKGGRKRKPNTITELTRSKVGCVNRHRGPASCAGTSANPVWAGRAA